MARLVQVLCINALVRSTGGVNNTCLSQLRFVLWDTGYDDTIKQTRRPRVWGEVFWSVRSIAYTFGLNFEERFVQV